MISFSAAQHILVTGASSGIGKSIALLLNALGATVIASGRSSQKLEQTRREASHPERMHLEVRDLSVELDGIEDWMLSVTRRHAPLHALACASGQTWNSPLCMYDAAQAHRAFDLCCHAPLLLGRAFCHRRNHEAQASGLVFIAAAAATDPNPGQGMYGAAKAALVNGVRCMAKEIARQGLRANCISPGLVQTPMMDETVRQLGADFLEREKARYPLGLGQPEDVAHLAAFLLSDKARWLSGQNIVLSGGR